jgi:hypothetical protein
MMPPLGRTRRLAAQVDEDSACLVAAAFMDARSQPRHPVVAAAYHQLARQADWWFQRLTGPFVPAPVRVAFTSAETPYRDEVELSESIRSHRVLELPSVAHDPDRRHPLLGGVRGGPLDRLRAVHDIVSHGWLQHDFSRDGEFSAWVAEDAMYSGLARWALATELHAHHSVRWTTGEVAPYKAALIHPHLLARSRRQARAVAAAAAS